MNLSESDRTRMLLAGGVHQAWSNCFKLWEPKGEIKGLRHHVRKPMHHPNFEERLGWGFGYKYFREWRSVVPKIGSACEAESTCAFDLLECMLTAFLDEDGGGPVEMHQIEVMLPSRILHELSFFIPKPFLGETVGEWLEFAESEGHL